MAEPTNASMVRLLEASKTAHLVKALAANPGGRSLILGPTCWKNSYKFFSDRHMKAVAQVRCHTHT